MSTAATSTTLSYNLSNNPINAIKAKWSGNWKPHDWIWDRMVQLADWVHEHHKCLITIDKSLNDHQTHTLQAVAKLPDVVIEELKKKIDPELIEKICSDNKIKVAIAILVDQYIKENEILQESRVKELEQRVEDLTNRITKLEAKL